MAEYRRELVAAAHEIENHRVQKKKLLEAHKLEVSAIKETAISTVTAGGLGYIEKRYPDRAQVAKVPISAVVAVAALGASLGGFVGKADSDNAKMLLAVGQGAAAAFAYGEGAKKGEKAKTTGDQQPKAA